MNITSVKKYIRNISLALLSVCIVLPFAAYIPHKVISDKNHTVIDQVGEISFIGPILIVIGIIEFLICFWNFIFNAKGSPFPDDQKHLIVKGLYRYVRNPMRISFCLIIFGEALFFQSMDLLMYLSVWIVYGVISIFFEERSLKKRFGETYEQYCEFVPRWIPRLTLYREKDSGFQ